MSPTDPVQELFDSALSAVPHANAPVSAGLHQRLHRRQRRTRVTALAGVTFVVAIATTVVLSSAPSNNVANAVTLYPQSSSRITASQLSVDRSVLAARLRSIGYFKASVKVVHGSLVVVNGPKNLADPAAILTSSPKLLIRKVLCIAGPPTAPLTTGPLPTHCSSPQYTLTKSTPVPNSVDGFSMAPQRHDPALAKYPTTSPGTDQANPGATALLPLGYSATQRLLVGPTQLTLTPHVASGTITGCRACGGWMVNVRLDKAEARIWDAVAAANFHLTLAIDLNGTVVENPLIEPTSSTFHSFDGAMQLVTQTKAGAEALMAVLRSGPLAVRLTPNVSSSTQGASS